MADQITYPKILATGQRTAEVEAHLQKLLALVGLEELPAREGGWDAERVWEDTLSLGEQQRLGIARLFYNKPRFGVLDECTSAVSMDVEERLYAAAKDLGITSITISQRLALTQFHSTELKLGQESDSGWATAPC